MGDVISVTATDSESLAEINANESSESGGSGETNTQAVATGVAISEAEHAHETAEEAVGTAEVAVITAEETQGELEEVKFDIGGMEARIVGAIDSLRDATERGLLLVAELVDKQPEVKSEPQTTDTPPKQEHFYNKKLWGNK